MSWMDSWSRPKKQSAVPPPLYLTAGDDVPYCKTCGRVMNSKKTQPAPNTNNTVKYCSARCRTRKPGAVDRRIEQAIMALLNGEDEEGLEKTAAKSKIIKGDRRIIVTMDEIEAIVFGSRFDPEKVHGRKKNRRTRALDFKTGKEEWKSVDMVDKEPSEPFETIPISADEARMGPLIRPPQAQSEVNGSIGGEKSLAERQDETEESMGRRALGDKRVEEREMVRRAARRGIVFGFPVEDKEGPEGQRDKAARKKKKKDDHIEDGDTDGAPDVALRKCEAIMSGQVVEPSFAKGDWAIRWRE